MQQTPALHPKALRHSPIRSVVITNADVDHIGGLLTLREKQPFELFVTSAIEGVLDANPIFKVLDSDHVARSIIRLDECFEPVPGLKARMFAVPGKVALYLEEGEPELGLEGEQTIGIEFMHGAKRAYYIPGCATLPDWLADRIRGADLVFSTALFSPTTRWFVSAPESRPVNGWDTWRSQEWTAALAVYPA